jgi:hypothetical protein
MDEQQVLGCAFSNVGSMCLQDGVQKVGPGTRLGRDPLPNPAVLEIKAAPAAPRPGVSAGLCHWAARPAYAGLHGLGTTDRASSFAARTVILTVADFLALHVQLAAPCLGRCLGSRRG